MTPATQSSHRHTPGDAPHWFDLLGKPKSSTDVSWVFSEDKKLHGSPLVERRTMTILEGTGAGDRGVSSFDPLFLDLLVALPEELNSAFSIGTDEGGFASETSFPSDFSALGSVPGYYMNPMSFAPVDNAAFVAELGLPSDFKNSRHRMIFDKFVHKIWANWKETSIKTPSISSALSPSWKSSARQKREHGEYLLKHHGQVLADFAHRDLSYVAGQHKVVFLKNQGRRGQSEPPPKKREVFDLEYALSSGRSGNIKVADKRVVMASGKEYPTLGAMRARLYSGCPYGANFYPQIIASGMLKSMFEMWPETFHCTDVPAMVAAIKPGSALICSDAKEYDRSMATFLLKRFFAIGREYWTEEIIDWCEHLSFAAYFSRPVALPVEGKPNPSVLVGDPYSHGDQVMQGNPSGVAFTAVLAKTMMVFDFLGTADDLFGDTFEQMDDYLNHKKTVKTCNNGDDGMFHGEAGPASAYFEYRFKGEANPGYFVLTPEVGNIWSGYFIIRNGASFRALTRPGASLGKIINPERPAGSIFRKYPTIGIIERINATQGHPLHAQVIDIFLNKWSQIMASEYGEFMTIVNAAHARVDINVDALTSIDKEVLQKPELLYYFYTDEDVSPNVLSMLFEQSFSPDELMPFVTANFSGIIHPRSLVLH